MKVELTVETSQPKGSQRAIPEGSPVPEQQAPLAVFDPAVRQGTQLSEEVRLFKEMLFAHPCVHVGSGVPAGLHVHAGIGLGLPCLAWQNPYLQVHLKLWGRHHGLFTSTDGPQSWYVKGSNSSH